MYRESAKPVEPRDWHKIIVRSGYACALISIILLVSGVASHFFHRVKESEAACRNFCSTFRTPDNFDMEYEDSSAFASRAGTSAARWSKLLFLFHFYGTYPHYSS